MLEPKSTGPAPRAEAKKLTEIRIEQLRARESDLLVKDGDTPGLYLRVRPSGRKTFVLRLKRPDPATGQRVNVVTTLGDWLPHGSGYTLKQARAEAHARSARSPAAAPRLTVKAALERHRRAHEEEGAPEARWRTQTRKSYATYRQFLADRIGARPVADVRRDELAAAFRAYVARGEVAANRLSSFTVSFFAWAVGEGLLDESPAQKLGMRQRQPGGDEAARERVLSDAELRLLWRLDRPHANLMRALLLTGCRIGELQRAHHEHVDAEGWLLIPEAHAKNRRAHRVWIVPEARAQFDGRAPLLFRHVSPTAVQSWARRMQFDVEHDDAPREPWKSARPRDEATGRPSPAWTPHDLRRTFATLAARAKVPEHIIVRLLNQTPAADARLSATLATYQRHEYLNERRAATEAVRDALLAIVA